MTNEERRIWAKEDILNLGEPLECRILAVTLWGTFEKRSFYYPHIPANLFLTGESKKRFQNLDWKERDLRESQGEASLILPSKTILGDAVPEKYLKFGESIYRITDVGRGLDLSCLALYVENKIPSEVEIYKYTQYIRKGGIYGADQEKIPLSSQKLKVYTNLPAEERFNEEEIERIFKVTISRQRRENSITSYRGFYTHGGA